MKPSHSMKLLWGIAALLGIVFAAASCTSPAATDAATEIAAATLVPTTDQFTSPLSPPPTTQPLTPDVGLGGARGLVSATPAAWQGQDLYCFFAPFYKSQESDGGFFLLEPSEHPSVQIDANGSFQLGTIPPGQYVIVIGPSPEDALAIRDTRGPRVFDITADTVLDLGDIRLEQ